MSNNIAAVHASVLVQVLTPRFRGWAGTNPVRAIDVFVEELDLADHPFVLLNRAPLMHRCTEQAAYGREALGIRTQTAEVCRLVTGSPEGFRLCWRTRWTEPCL
jgi:hypothetical protein